MRQENKTSTSCYAHEKSKHLNPGHKIETSLHVAQTGAQLKMVIRMISGLSRKADGICVLLGYYTVYSSNSLPITIICCRIFQKSVDLKSQ